MAAINFIHFKTWNELENYCQGKALKVLKSKNGPFIAEILNKNNAPVGFISDRVQDYKPIISDTKYVLVWE